MLPDRTLRGRSARGSSWERGREPGKAGSTATPNTAGKALTAGRALARGYPKLKLAAIPCSPVRPAG